VATSVSLTEGHYIGWARKDDGSIVPVGEEVWYKYDGTSVLHVTLKPDDKVSTVNTYVSSIVPNPCR